MMYYREQKEQEQEKAKREQAIAEFHLDQKHEESEKKREKSKMCKNYTLLLVPKFFFLFFSCCF